MGEESPSPEAFRPSWIHKLLRWIDRLPGPYWLCYLGVLVATGLLNQVVAWIEDVVPFGQVNWYYAFTGFFLAFWTFEIDFLLRITRDALVDFRPILDVPDDEFERLAFEFTHLPARPTAVVFLLGTIAGLVLGVYVFPTSLEMNPAFPALELPIFALTSGVGYVAIYMVIRAFVLINRVYERVTTVSIFDQDSLYALSRYSAWFILFLIIQGYLLFVLAPSLAEFALPYLIGIDLLGVALVLAIFWFPVRRVHCLLVLEKQRLLKDVNLRIQTTFGLLHARIDQGDFGRIVEVREALQSLTIEKEFIESLRTWPWKPSTLTGLLSVVVLPLLISLVTELVSRFLGS